MKPFSIFLSLVFMAGLVSCKKETDELHFNPVGYWEGNAYLYRTVMLNKADGTSSIYFRVYNSDTTAAAIKGYGTYTIAGNRLKTSYTLNNVQTLYIDVKTVSPDEFEGKLYLTATGEAVECNLWKQ